MTALLRVDRLAPQVDAGVEVGQVRVSPDGARLAFARFDGADAGVYVSRADGAGVVRLVNLGGWRVDDLAWSPSGMHLAYLMREEARPGGGPRVGWCLATSAGQVGYLEGSAMAWTPRGNALLVADPARGALVRQMMASGRAEALLDLKDDGNPQLPVAIAISPDGSRTAYVTHDAEADIAEVWVATKDIKNAVTTELITEVPGAAAQVLPFWSAKGVTLGLWVVHIALERSALIVVPRLEGEGVILHERELVCPAETPAWSPSGSTIALWSGRSPRHPFTKVADATLALLTPQTHAVDTVACGDVPPGRTWFVAPDRVVVDGGPAAHVLTMDAPL